MPAPTFCLAWPRDIECVPTGLLRAIASGDPERIEAAVFNAGLLAYGAYKAVGEIRGAIKAKWDGTSGSGPQVGDYLCRVWGGKGRTMG